MKRINVMKIGLLVIVSILFTSCEVIEGIFKAGMGVGIFLVILIIAIIIYILNRLVKK